MAEKVLTAASTLTCKHDFGITFTATGTLHVAGHAVVLPTDLAAAKITCSANEKCTLINKPIVAGTLGNAVLATGLTTNLGPIKIDNNQDLLTAE